MMPRVNPDPLSAWTLVGLSAAYPQPSAISCCVDGRSAGPAFAAGGGKPRPPGGGVQPGSRYAPPNMIMTGTAFVAAAGVTSPIWMSTSIAGNAELSTCPVSCFTTTSCDPSFAFVVDVTVHVTFGA